MMHTSHKISLIRRAIVLFPRRTYLQEGTVRHARREYLKAVEYLRNSPRWAELYDEPQSGNGNGLPKVIRTIGNGRG
jgi:hypothetical protein